MYILVISAHAQFFRIGVAGVTGGRVARRFSISSAGPAATVASCPQEKLIRGPLMAQRKNGPNSDATTKAYAYYEWMDRAKEERLPEIYCLGVHPLSASCTRGPGGGGEAEKAGRRCRSAETRRGRKTRGRRETETQRKGRKTEEEGEEEERAKAKEEKGG